MWKWKNGRLNDEYSILTIASSYRFAFDVHLIRIKKNGCISSHIDPIPKSMVSEGYIKHTRINFILTQPTGGIFHIENKPIYDRIIKFRPDIQPHSVSSVKHGTRYVLSIGWFSKT